MKHRYIPFALILILSLFSLTTLPGVGATTPGTLDPSFNGSGVVATHLGDSAIPFGVAVQNDSKLVAGGYALLNGNYSFALARYTPSGTLDATFGPYANGTTHTLVGKGAAYFGYFETRNGLALQSDGKLVVAGYVLEYSGKIAFALARYTSSGILDTTFGPNGNGTLTTEMFAPCSFINGLATSVSIQSDGKIVVGGAVGAGACAGEKFALLRYTSSGSLDPSFGPYMNGTLTTQIGANPYGGWTYAVAIQGDGKILLAGETYNSTSVQRFALARYTSSGVLDAGFGPNMNGTLTTLIGTNDGGGIQDLGIQTDGKILAAGTATISGKANFAIARYTSSGLLDTSFGASGITTTPLGTGAFAYSLAIQTNGKIIVGGNSFLPDGLDLVLMRYTQSGTLDPSFGSSGITTTHLSNAGVANGLALQSDGKIVAVGQIDAPNHLFGIARYLGDTTSKIGFATSPATGGSINFNGTTYTNGQSINYTGTTATISATPPAGHTFSSWSTSGGISVTNPTTNPTTATITGPGTLTAVFTSSTPINPSSLILAGSIATAIPIMVKRRRR